MLAVEVVIDFPLSYHSTHKTNNDYILEARVRITEIEEAGEAIDQDQGDASIQYFLGHNKGQYTLHHNNNIF